MVLTEQAYRSITGPIDEALGLPDEAYTKTCPCSLSGETVTIGR